MFDASDGAHLLKYGFRGREGFPKFLFGVSDMTYIRSKYKCYEADKHPSVFRGLGTYPQTVFAENAFLHHEGLLLLVPHPVVALGLHRVEIEPESLAGEEPARESGLPDSVGVNFEGAQLATLPEGDLHKVVVLAERIAVFLRYGLARRPDCLQDLRLVCDGKLDPCKVIRPFVDVEVQVKLQAVRLDDVVAVALDLILKVVLLVEQPGLFREGHPLRDSGGQIYRLDHLERLTLAALDARYELLPLGNAALKIVHGLVSAVSDKNDVPEAGVLQLGHYHVEGPRVGNVAGKFQIVDWKMRRKRVYNDFKGLLERKMLLVVPPADIHEVEAVRGDGCGVHGAELVFAHPLRPEPEQVHAVLLGDMLRKAGDAGTCERMPRRGLHLALPLLDMRVAAVIQEQVIGKCQDILSNLKVAVEYLLQVAQQSGLPGDIVKEPRRAVHPVQVSALVFNNSAMPRAGKGLDLREVPVRRKDEFPALLKRRVEVRRVRMEPVPVLEGAPVLVRVAALPILADRVRMRHCVRTPVIDMNTHLVNGVGFCRSSFCHR